jgi:colanic acid biosynthesis glycosyl transferase WcaI
MNEGDSSKSAGPAGTSGRLKVLIINQSYWPDHVATAQHAHDLARFLVRRGDEVTVIASRRLYGQRGTKLPKQDLVDGVRVHRVPGGGFGKERMLGRILDFIAFLFFGTIRALRLPKHDVVICLTTPPYLAVAGVLLRKVKGSRCVLWSMDLYPDLPAAAGLMRHRGATFRFFDFVDRCCFRAADHVVVLGRCMWSRVLTKGASPDRLEIIPPWSDPQEIPSTPARQLSAPVEALGSIRMMPRGGGVFRTTENRYRKEWDIGDRFVIQYSGNCGFGHDLETVFEAMERLKGDDSIRWVFVGGGVFHPTIERFVRERGIPNVIIKPYQPRESLGECLALADVHLVLMSSGFEGIIVPSKFYGVMAASRPVIFVGPCAAEAARVIMEERCGIVIPDGSASLLVRAIHRLRERPSFSLAFGQRGRRALERAYSLECSCEAWRRSIHALAAGHAVAGRKASAVPAPLRILIISQYFPPDITAAAYRIGDTAKLLRRAGHEVRVITSTPHKGGIDALEMVGISADEVIRIPVNPLEDRKATSYIGQYVRFAMRALLAALRLKASFRYDVVWASSPPLLIAICTIPLRWLSWRPVVLDIRDLWPETAVNVGKIKRGSATERIGKLLESAAYTMSDRITCVSRPMARYIAARTRRPVAVVYNGAPRDQIQSTSSIRPDHHTFCYAGNLGFCQGLEGVVEAFSIASSRPGMEAARLRFIGTGVIREDLERLAEAKGLSSRIEFLGVKPKHEALALMSASGALLIPLQNSPAFELTVPSKVFDCMGLGVPIIASIRGEGREILERSGANIVVDPDDVSAMAEAMHRMHSDWAAFRERSPRNAEIVSRDFSRESAVDQLERTLAAAARR